MIGLFEIVASGPLRVGDVVRTPNGYEGPVLGWFTPTHRNLLIEVEILPRVFQEMVLPATMLVWVR